MAAKKDRAAAPKAAPRKAAPRAAAPKTGLTPRANAQVDVSPDELRKLISEAAYYRAKQRGFTPGHELEDWIQAEAEVRKRVGT
jgi:hypothetical protein